jgi:hypothetical protein
MSSFCSVIVTFSALLLLSAGATDPQQDPGMTYAVSPEGISVATLIADWSAQTGRKFVTRLDPSILERRLILTGKLQYAPADADYMFESIIASAGLALLPAGPKDSKLFTVEDTERPAGVKSRASFVHQDKLGALSRFPAQVFTTAIRLKHIKVEHVRNAIQQVLTNRNVEFAMDLQAANALMVVGFGPTIAAVSELIAVIDVPGAEPPERPDRPETRDPGRK